MERISRNFEQRMKRQLHNTTLPLDGLSLLPFLDAIVEYLLERNMPNPPKKVIKRHIMQNFSHNEEVFENVWVLIREACRDLLSSVHGVNVKQEVDGQLGAYLLLEYFLRHKERQKLNGITDEGMKRWLYENVFID